MTWAEARRKRGMIAVTVGTRGKKVHATSRLSLGGAMPSTRCRITGGRGRFSVVMSEPDCVVCRDILKREARA